MKDQPEASIPSRHPATAWLMLAVAVPLGGWLVYEIQRTIGLNDPHLWELLRTDRVFDLAMLDFILTASWAYLVIMERSNRKDWQFWVVSVVFFAIPSLAIVLYILLDRSRPRQEPSKPKDDLAETLS